MYYFCKIDKEEGLSQSRSDSHHGRLIMIMVKKTEVSTLAKSFVRITVSAIIAFGFTYFILEKLSFMTR